LIFVFLEIGSNERHDFGMRPVPGGVFFLCGFTLWHCSVFPEHAPVVGSSTGGSNAAGGRGANDSGASGAHADADAQHPASGGQETGGVPSSGGALGSGGNAGAGDAGTPDVDVPLDGSVRTVSYVATVADCLEAVIQPQRGSCLSYSTSLDGPNELWVDIRRTGRRAFTAYLAFDIDATTANRTVVSVELRMTVTTYANAAGTGADVWEVAPFTDTSLYLQTPAVVDTTPLAATPGVAAQGQTVTYSLPNSVATPGSSLYLSLTLPMGGDGTGYWGTNGDPKIQAPPTVVITYR
jgi:hypothetical protein